VILTTTRLLLAAFLFALFCEPILHEGNYFYSVTWEKVKVADAVISIKKSDSAYLLEIKAKTLSWLKPFYSLDYNASITVGQDFKESAGRFFKRDKNEIEKVNFTLNTEKKGKVLKISREVNKINSNKVKVTNKEIHGAWDPFSAALAAIVLDWEEGKQQVYLVNNGKTEYSITLKCTEEKFDENNKVFTIQPLIQSSNKSQIKKLKRSEIVLQDSPRLVKQIKNRVFIGNVYMKFEKKLPADNLELALNLQPKTKSVKTKN